MTARLTYRFGYAALLLANVSVLVGLHAGGWLDEWAIIGVHWANIAVLVAMEFITPLNREWLLVRPDTGVRWRLLLKTYLWYAFDSRVWFRLHGVLLFAFASWVASFFVVRDAAGLPVVAQVVLLAVGVDLARYWIHRAQHSRSFLWRWHTMHHAPTNLTPVRAWWTHPVDDTILYSLEIVAMVVLRLDPVAVLAYLSIDNFFQLLNHTNVRLHSGWLGTVLQHPRYHLLHHRRHGDDERPVNFGEMLTCWDRLFGTFEERDLDDMSGLEIGLSPREGRTLVHQLTAPFYRPVDAI